MPIPPFPMPGSIDLETLQTKINLDEKIIRARLINLKGMEENGEKFNLLTYNLVDDNNLPLSKLFEIKGGGPPQDDPDVKKWLAQPEHKDQKIRSDEKVYIRNSLTKVAVVN